MKWNILNNEEGLSLKDKLLKNRKIDNPEVFFHPDFERDLGDPWGFKDMQKAVERVRKAIESNQKIAVHGDYDVDGVTGSTILNKAFEATGYKDLLVYLPHRLHDGYGLNKNTIKKLKDKGIDLLITVDCGISNVEEIAYANELGMDVIITDHHSVPADLPKAYAIIHPRLEDSGYSFGWLAGVGVVYKFAHALLSTYLDAKELEQWIKWNLDMVAIGTVADCQMLQGENRLFVKMGLQVLQKTRNIGLQKMLMLASKEGDNLGVMDIGYVIGPRINAAGRMEHPEIAFNLFNAKTEAEAIKFATEIQELNITRQEVFKSMLKEAEDQLREELPKLLIFKQDDWHHGVTGLVSGKMSERFYRPVISFEKRENIYVASARSISGYNITEAISQFGHLLIKYGGHAEAAGFSVHEDKFDEFCSLISDHCNKYLDDNVMEKMVDIDGYINKDDISLQVLKILEEFEPYGIGNPSPIFAVRARVIKIDRMGKDKNHTALTLDIDGKVTRAIWFGESDFDVSLGSKVEVAATLEKNEWNGNISVELRVIDVKIV